MFQGLRNYRKKTKAKLKGRLHAGFKKLISLVNRLFGWEVNAPASTHAYYQFYKLFKDNTKRTAGCTVPQETLSLASESALRVVAFYLPQFHPIPENDKAWGKGFTEWTNVSKAFPEFNGHYQPQLPGELGFYNLTDARVIQRQVEMATLSGIHAFCFHYYWFSGKRLLEKPMETFMSLKLGDFRFCINWANENWTKRWDGLDNEVIIQQEDRPNDAEQFFADILPVLRHPNYIQIKPGVPLLLIYRPDKLHNPKQFVATLRHQALEAGFNGLHVVMCQVFGSDNPTPLGFDAACEFPPHGLNLKIKTDINFLNDGFAGHVLDASNIVAEVESSFAIKQQPFPVFRCAFPGWDNSARKPGAGDIMHGMSPSIFQNWLQAISQKTYQDHEGRPWVFINAWNEWGEGAHLEPDRQAGFKNLNAVARVIDRNGLNKRRSLLAPLESPLTTVTANLAILLHIFHEELVDEFLQQLKALDFNFDFYVTLSDTVTTQAVQQIIAQFPAVRILEVANRGRDVLPFLKASRHFNLERYGAVCKLHSKKSPHRIDGDSWRKAMFADLLSPAGGTREITEFAKSPDAGLLAPQFSLAQISGETHPANIRHLNELFKKHSIKPCWDYSFPAGTMFWASGRLLEKINSTLLTEESFEPENGQTDGTQAHAYERFFAAICQSSGWKILGIKNSENTFSF